MIGLEVDGWVVSVFMVLSFGSDVDWLGGERAGGVDFVKGGDKFGLCFEYEVACDGAEFSARVADPGRVLTG